MMDVKFLRGLSTKFATITPDSKTFYFLTDTNELYLGSVLLSNEVTAEEFDKLVERVGNVEGSIEEIRKQIESLPFGDYLTTSAFQNWLTTVYEPHVAEYEAHLVAQDKRDDAQEGRLTALESTIEGIVSVGGQANVIEKIKVDGVEVPVEEETKTALIVLDKTYEKIGVAAGLVATEKDEREAADADLQAQIDKIEAVLPTLDTDTNTTYTLTHNVEAKELVLTPSEGAAQTVSLAGYETVGVAEDLVKAEEEARAAADEDLQKAIAAEAEIREAADEDLQKQIDAIEATLPTIDTNTEYHVEYDSTNKKIKLVAGADASKMEIDATDFIKDGMIDTVTIGDDNDLVITFNTEAGKEDIRLPLDQLVDIYTGGATDTVTVSVSTAKEVTASVNTNSIKDGHIATDAAIAETKLAQGVQTALALARTALQSHQDLSAYATIEYVNGKVKDEKDRAEGIEAGLQEQIDALEVKHSHDIADLDARLDKVEPAIPEMEKDIKDLEERVVALETGLEDEAKERAEADSHLQEQIDALDKRVDVIEDQLDGFDTKKGAVKEYVDAADAVLAEQIEANANICEKNFTTIVNQLTWGEF